MDEDGVDLTSLGPGRRSPLHHNQYHGSTEDAFPESPPQQYTPGPYDPSFEENTFEENTFEENRKRPRRTDSQAQLLRDDMSKRDSSRTSRTVSFAPLTSTSPYLGRRDPNLNWRSRLSPPSCKPRWHPSFSMCICFIFGILCAVGHHIFYSTLDGQLAQSQGEMQRYGTFLAYAAKAGFSAAVVSAFKQRVWVTVRSRFMPINALDSMFAAAEDIVAMFNWEFLKGAKGAFALALFAWTTPLVVILTANTLLVEPRTVHHNTTCPAVRTLNFSFEETNEWRNPKEIDGLFEIPLSIWNTTKRGNDDSDDWFDYYTGPSPNFQQTATLSAFLEDIVARKNASSEICGTGWNCTFNIEFIAPGYKCAEMASGVGSTPKNLTQESGEAVPPFGIDFLLPQGNYSYYTYATGGEYSTTQLKDVGIGGIPNIPNNELPAHFGALRTEPVIWVGYVVLNNPNGTTQPNRTDPGWNEAFTPKIFACEHRETVYAADFNYADGTQSANITSRVFGQPIINTTYLPNIQANDGTDDNITAVPESNYVYPNDTRRYRKVASYHSLGYMLRDFLNGTVEVEDTLVNPIQNTDAIQTKLLDPRNNYFPYSSLMEDVQSLYEDLILSMFSNPQFVEVVWAARPGEQSGTLLQGGMTTSSGATTGTGNTSEYMYNCTRYRTANTYTYHQRDLWIIYGIAATVTLICITAGIFAIAENGGVTRNTHFSSVVAATRGPALEKIVWMGPLQDRGDVPEEVKTLKLGYGVMNDMNSNRFSMADVGPDPNLMGVEDEAVGTSTGRQYSDYPTDMRCGFGLKGDVDQRHREGSLFHR